MPRKKIWFPFNQGFNDDGELWDLTDRFGDRSLRLWMEICAILDRTENRWEMTESSCKAIFRKSRIKPATGWQVIGWTLASHWLGIPQSLAGRQPAFYGSPNYWKYHPSAESEKFFFDSLLPSFLPDSSLKKEKNPEPPPLAGSLKTTPTRSETEKPRSDFEPLLQFAVKIAGGDPGAQQKLCQWTMSMIAFMKADPKERTLAVVKSSLETLKAKIDAGYQITSLWGLLTTIFNQERTKYIQGPEHAAYKQPIAVPADINKLMKGIG